jgi:hypothetical protein
MITLDLVRSVESLARANYTYKHDPENNDNWYSYHEYVERGDSWSDDCDSLTSTVVNLLIKRGLPLDKAWFAHVDSNHDGIMDHMIGFIELPDGSMWVVGDTFGPCYRAENMRHHLKKFCKLTNIQSWYAGHDFRQMKMI